MTAYEQLASRRLAVDIGTTVLLALVVVPLSFSWGFDSSSRAPLWALLLVAPLAWRRVYPTTSAVAVFAVALAHLLVGPPLVLPADLAVLAALYSVTVHGPRLAGRTAMGAVVVGAGLFVVQGLRTLGGLDGLMPLGAVAFAMSAMGLAVWAFGLLRRSRQATLDALRDRAERLEREQEQRGLLSAAAERARIAREMHDVVAHSLSVVVAQADGGRYAAEADPEAAARALETIGETGRAALADVRRILGVLRTGPEDPADTHPDRGRHQPSTPPELAPQPVSAELEPLLDQVRSSGVPVSLVQLGTPRTLPAAMGLNVYRICQEALTNVLKHAGPDAKVTLLQQWGPSSLILDITDDGRGASASSDGAGHGLLGMRERVALFGGTVAATPRPGGGFRVLVELPLPALQGDVTRTTATPDRTRA